jgi:diguanylate cyclase (GGDEF)-like protein
LLILVSSTNIECAKIQAERLRKSIMPHKFEGIEQLTCSFGISGYRADNEDCQAVVRRADAVLYQAKENGRNRVDVFMASENPITSIAKAINH